jgi:hypothetical protein
VFGVLAPMSIAGFVMIWSALRGIFEGLPLWIAVL